MTYTARGESHRLTVLRSADTVTIGGLDAGTRYAFTIVAKNADGKDTITARNGKENLATSTIRATTQGFTAARAVPFLKRASATPDTVSL
ncbi:MAG: fibronectin type III domain-containing protein [Planctomycetaceae bacterium]|nr:fibronectin type III domain-containing protein [Planctomycetaceae bacterium]